MRSLETTRKRARAGPEGLALRPPATANRAGPTFSNQMSEALALAEDISARHRRSFPADAVRERLHGMIDASRVMFHPWTLEICFLLDHHDRLRYNALKNELGSISSRTLASKLSYLREHGVVDRDMIDSSPPSVEYSLTTVGRRFVQLMFLSLVEISSRMPKDGAASTSGGGDGA